MTTNAVLSITEWPTNGHLFADLARLGYINHDDLHLDPTYGLGNFYTQFRPQHLVAGDINPTTPDVEYMDFTDLPYIDAQFSRVIFDPPYKLNGTPDPELDRRYGVDGKVRWQDRMKLIRLGVVECARVTADNGLLLVKVQDQVCSGQIRWQTDLVAQALRPRPRDEIIWRKRDRLDFVSYRPQPAGRSQEHSRQNHSTLLVFERTRRKVKT